MHETLRYLGRGKLFALLFLLLLHGAVLNLLCSYRVIPTEHESSILMVNLFDPPSRQQPKTLKRKFPEPDRPQAPIVESVEPRGMRQMVSSAVILEEPSVSSPALSLAPTSVIGTPAQLVTMSGELSVSCPERAPPEYPQLSMRMNEHGKAVLQVELGEDGRVTDAQVKISSGYRRLDVAALNSVRTWRCKPSTRNGVAVRAVALQPFSFILEGK